MTEIVIYRADDGTDFEDEYDCKQYEWELGVETAQYSLLNHHFKLLDNKSPSSYDDAFFIFIPSQQSAWDLLNNWDTDIIAIDVPAFLPYRAGQEVELGLWAWDEERERWYHLGKKVDELTQMATKAMDAINGI